MKTYLTISGYCLFFALLSISWMPLQEQKEKILSSGLIKLPNPVNTNSPNEDIALLYSSLKLQQKGLSKQAFEYAYKGYRRLLKKQIISREGYLVICDFSQSSNNKRLYLVDMVNNEVLLNTYVAHGRNSGGEYANQFSNRLQSLQSSLGFYVTQNTYYGEHGLSLRMKGLEPGYNDKANRRRIVVHGADYIGDPWLERNNYMGRSYGCPAIPEKESNFLIHTIKSGSCIFIYHPSKSYLKGSKILNG
ncbi:MAG TPA: murein L,D-transpeptidase catalytic domain family protein [Chitinophagaceae bacterium]|nr:murein L,D-transpeptidase catalytic domain family protein [Chitinophagaceae bacterium]